MPPKFLLAATASIKSSLAAFLDQLFGLGLGQLCVVAGLHSVVTTALSLGTQVGSVAEHLCQRHVSVDLDSTGTGDLAQDVTTASSDVTDNGAHVLIGNSDGNLHDGLQNSGICLAASFLECHGTSDLECHFGGVDFVVGTIEQSDLHVDDGIAGQNTSLQSTLDTLIDSGDVFLGNSTAGYGVNELVTLTGLVGLNGDLNVTVLTGTTGLTLVLALVVDLLLDGLLDRKSTL